MIQPMTAHAESRLNGALDETARLVEDEGLNPTEAIAKSAEVHGIPPGHVALMARAYNVARTIQQQGESSTDKRAEAFDLADAAQALELLYPTHAKTAATRYRETVVSSDYDRPPTWLAPVRAVTKTAALKDVVFRMETSGAPVVRKLPGSARRAAGQKIARALQPLETSRLALVKDREDLDRLHRKLASYFRGASATPWADVRTNAILMAGDAGATALDKVGAFLPDFSKKASSQPYHRVDRTQTPYAEVFEAIDRAARFQRDAIKFAEELDTASSSVAPELSAMSAPPAFPPAAGGEEDDDKTPDGMPAAPAIPVPGMEPKMAGVTTLPKQIGIATAVSTARDAILGMSASRPPRDGSDVERGLRLLSSPDHEQTLRDLHTQSLLHDLLAHDPIISGYDPRRIAGAFNEISQLAPRTATQPLLLAPVLRKRLQLEALDSFDGDQMVGTEGKLKALSASQGGPSSAPAK
jgi:hypothetical protein